MSNELGGFKMNYRIAVVEDDENIRHIVSTYLQKEGYDIELFESAEEAQKVRENNPPHMWVLDIMLPGMDGYEFCKRIRETSDVPIIIISAKDEEVDKIIGLELGGDDYLTKPFSPRELVARVRRLFARTYQTIKVENDTDIIKVDQLEINEDKRKVSWNNEEIEVTVKEFELLIMLAKNPERAFSREELLHHVWGNDYFGSDRAVDDLVKRIRKKIPEINLDTVWGFGYRLSDKEAAE